jgi:imidazolonepropionase-like amidohydrolase
VFFNPRSQDFFVDWDRAATDIMLRAEAGTLDPWLHLCNHEPYHTAIGGATINRVNNVIGAQLGRTASGLRPNEKGIEMNRLVLTNVNLLDGENPAVRNRTVVVEGDRITSVGADLATANDGDRVVDLQGRTVMPGMATCHYHSTLPSGDNGGLAPYGYEFPAPYQALLAHRNLMTALEQGYTIVVGAGSSREIDPGIKKAIEDGLVLGPRFVPSGRELSTTGHANDLTIPWHWGLPELGAARNCDGAEAFRYAVRDEVKKGVEVIKLFVTRGHLVKGANDTMEMTRDELGAAIETAHERGVLVRGHLAGKRAIMMSIELGIDIVDHCDEMDDEVISALAETGIFVVPSIHYIKAFLNTEKDSMFTKSSAEARAESKRNLEFMYDALPKAEAAGVRLLLGDDYGGLLRHGQYGEELHTYIEDAGLAPLAVIRWATRNGADVIRRGDDLGTIEAGKLADLLVIDGDPSDDIRVLADKKPLAVLKGGQIVCGALPDEHSA